MSDAVVGRMVEILKDPLFVAIRRAAAERPLLRSEFKKMPKPEGMTSEQAWKLLSAIRRQTAIILPFSGASERQGWYSATHSILADLDDIGRRCHEGSWLDSTIQSLNATYYLIEAHVNNATAATREDGFDLGYEKAREVLLGERCPESPEETLLLNGHRAIGDLERYDKAPCTPELIVELCRRVADGVGGQVPTPSKQTSRLWGKNRFDSIAALLLISRLVNREGVDSAEHPLVLALGVRFLFMSTFPLPAWNGVVCSLVMKLLFRKAHLPALVFAPLVEAYRAWEEGTIRPPHVMATVKNSQVLIDDEIDYTVYVGIIAQLTRLKLDETETELKRVIKRDEAFAQALRRDIDINHRQRTVLHRALNNPEAVFRIGPHQATHRVAYATARADLLHLSDLGFLERRQAKRAFEFSAAPGLRQLLLGHAQEHA